MENLNAKMLNIVKEVTAEKMSSICESWMRSFDEEKGVPALIMQLRQHYETFINQIESSVLEMEEKLKVRVEGLLNERKLLEQELNLTISIPSGDDLPLYSYLKQLEEILSIHRYQFAQRQEEVARLRNTEMELIKELVVEPRPIKSPKHLLLSDEIQQVEDRIKALQTLKQSRLDDIKKHRLAGKVLLKKLHKESWERFYILMSDGEYLQPTMENVMELQKALHELELHYADKVRRFKSISKELNEIYDELEVDESQRFEVDLYTDMNILTAELARLKQMFLSKLPQLIENLRKRTIDLSQKCYKSEMFRHHSAAFYCPIYTEKYQKRLLMELNQLESSYNLNKDIYMLIAERDCLRAKLAEHNQKLLDNKGRFKNRGGQLLKDEKERKSLEKSLQKVEASLATAVEAYKAKYKAQFLVFDEPIQINRAASPSKLSKELKKQNSMSDLRLRKPFGDRSNTLN